MSEVYANILETLTSGLYNDVKYAVREYLQNAYDAIKQASVEKLPIGEDGFYVDVAITRNSKIITITDNGVGMDVDLLKEYTSIGGGTKNSPEYAGHKGIGKLSGLRFFDEFRVKTKVCGATTAYELHWKCGDMMKVLMHEKDKMKKTPYKDFISKFFTIQEVAEDDKKRHYTQIQLLNVADQFKDQISEDRIGYFIKQNCPVPFYDEQFNYSDKIKKYMGNDLLFINTYINGKVIYQLYNDKYKITEPRFVEIKYDDRVRAKAWFTWIKDTAEVIEDDKIRGLRFRCKGLCVGDSNLFANNCMPPGRDQIASWFIGEIVVLDDDIRPSAARDRFYEGSDIRKLYSELRNKIGKELSFIADIRSHISAAEKGYNAIKAIEKEGKTVPVALMKDIDGRVRDLKRDRDKDRYGFDFSIIAKLEKVLKGEEDREIINVHETETELNKIKEKGQEAIIDKMLKLKEEQQNAYSKNVKATKQAQIEELKKIVVEQKFSAVSTTISSDEKVKQIMEIIIKYLDSKGFAINKSEIARFVENELRRK
jgi:hypothetical protein